MKYHLSLVLFFFFNLCHSQILLDVDLSADQQTEPINFTIDTAEEIILYINASSNTMWSLSDSESSVLEALLDNNYHQDIVLYNGQQEHTYKIMLGYLQQGEHSLIFYFNYLKSSINAEIIHIESIEIIDPTSLDIDTDILKYSPILYGRDIYGWNESNRTDIPLLMWHDVTYNNSFKTITYSFIFSNEDSRIGHGLTDMMVSWGRTTDIEWAYQVKLDNNGNILEEFFQGASHITTPFNGEKYDMHPILKNATPNCNFSDTGTSDYKFFLSPEHTINASDTRETLMDQNEWTYKIMAEELINENKYEIPTDPLSTDISNAKNYIYFDITTDHNGSNGELHIGIKLFNDCNTYLNDYNNDELYFSLLNGSGRTSIELPENFNPEYIKNVYFNFESQSNFELNINEFNRVFYLSDNYEIINLNPDSFYPITLTQNNPEALININSNDDMIDCLGMPNGEAFCDDCDICSGGESGHIPNSNLDECGICFGNNEDMDCNDICFGSSYLDECGVCDGIIENDNESCSGCTDPNALNYDPDALVDDGSCIYDNDDNIIIIPDEYSSIQLAIQYADQGDTLIVMPGQYEGSLNFLGKDIVLSSQRINDSYPYLEETVIIADDSSTVITFENNESSECKLIGLTIKNGYGRGIPFQDFVSIVPDQDAFLDALINDIRAGGISVINANPTIENVIIKDNVSRNVAAGLGLVNSSSMINNVIITNNTIPDGDAIGGGGIAINGGSPLLLNSEISYNTIGMNEFNLAGGGAILLGFSFDGNNQIEFEIDNVNLNNNYGFIGGAICILSGQIISNQLTIHSNAAYIGAAISLGEPFGLVVSDIYLSMNRATITNNNGENVITLGDYSIMDISNTILWNTDSPEIQLFPNNSLINADIIHSNLEEIYECDNNMNISSDPLFIDSMSNNFQLQADSPCIDAGTSDIDNDGIEDIFDYYGSAPDIGAFEFYSEIEGDINNDGEININDIILIISFILEEIEPTDEEINQSDLNNDQSIDIYDIILLIHILLD